MQLVSQVQSLQKKHQALEIELISREPVVSSLATRAQQMIRTGHFATPRIEAQAGELAERLAHLKDLAAVRRLRLLDAVESQVVSGVLILTLIYYRHGARKIDHFYLGSEIFLYYYIKSETWNCLIKIIY